MPAANATATAAAALEAASTVTVACKLPGGLHLQLHKMVEVQEPIMGGGWRTVEQARPHGVRYTVHGFARAIDKAPEHTILAGYGLTPNIDGAFFAEWLRQNAEHDAVRNNLIFALPKPESAAARARDQAAVKSGLEPVSRSALPRGIATADHKPPA